MRWSNKRNEESFSVKQQFVKQSSFSHDEKIKILKTEHIFIIVDNYGNNSDNHKHF